LIKSGLHLNLLFTFKNEPFVGDDVTFADVVDVVIVVIVGLPFHQNQNQN